MGIYSNTRFNSVGTIDIDVPTNENYNLVTGCAMALAEGYQNDLAIFEATIRSDMEEIHNINEGYEVLNESAKDVWNKIKELFMKLLEKIKGIFKSFMARISGVFTDSEKLYDRYSKTISNCKSWKGFKAKWRKPKKDDIIKDISEKGKYDFQIYEEIYNYNDDDKLFGFKMKDIVSTDSNIDNSDIFDAIVKYDLHRDIRDDISKLDDINKALMDVVFDDEESVDNWNSGDILGVKIGGLLKNQTKNRNTIDKYNANLESSIQKVVNNYEKESKIINNALSNATLGKSASYQGKTIHYGSGDYETGKTKVNITKSSSIMPSYSNKDELGRIEKLAQFRLRIANQEQAVINKLTSARLAAYKFAITQARRVFSSAAAFASVEHKNEAYDYEYYTAIGEAVEYDTLSDLQAV